MDDVFQISDISVQFRTGPSWRPTVINALKNVSLDIPPGMIIGLVGESGSGKTTLGRVCLGLQPITSGSVSFLGRQMGEASRSNLKGKLAAVLQNPRMSLNPALKIATSVAEPLKIADTHSAKEQHELVDDMLAKVGLDTAIAERFPNELSGGQRQRVSIARALITNPKFILFDEAVSALDVSVQAQILNLTKELQQSIGFSALFISHDLAATRYVSDRVMVLYHGEVMEICDRSTLYGSALHPYTRGLQVASGLISDQKEALKSTFGPSSEGGCVVRNRCPKAMPICSEHIPSKSKKSGSTVFCHLHNTGENLA